MFLSWMLDIVFGHDEYPTWSMRYILHIHVTFNVFTEKVSICTGDFHVTQIISGRPDIFCTRIKRKNVTSESFSQGLNEKVSLNTCCCSWAFYLVERYVFIPALCPAPDIYPTGGGDLLFFSSTGSHLPRREIISVFAVTWRDDEPSREQRLLLCYSRTILFGQNWKLFDFFILQTSHFQ